MKSKVIAIIHTILFAFSLSSPFWIDWKIVVVGFILYMLQKLILKGCLLSFAQFGSRNGRPIEHFTPYYLKKIFGIKAEEHMIIKYLDYVVAPLVPVLAVLLQLVFKLNPWIKV